ncbi:XRE family transcriptional regulator [Streptomyces sp. NPDC056831]|uniref:XRE family transcriptional regulator n=1 Tax=Streptomyces sp. NPDC056831 TaxID=3345954 RepID=UPI0036755D62
MDELILHPLAYARRIRGMTRADLAREICAAAERRGLRSGTDKSRVRKWETGVTPDKDSRTYIADVFKIPRNDALTRDWPHWLPGADERVIPLGPDSAVPALREALRAAMDPLDRRNFLTFSGSALTALATSWSTSDTRPLAQAMNGGTVDEDLVMMLEETSPQLNRLATEQRQHAVILLDAHLSTVVNLIRHGRHTPAITQRLHTMAASLSQTVAWNRFDRGLHTAAAKLWIAGLHSAHANGDRDMGAALLGDLAYQASWRGYPQTAASILERALTRTSHPTARSLLQLRLARAHAAQGDTRATHAAITVAEKSLAAASGRPVPAWCSWMSEADLAVDTGQCLLDLGETRRAHQLIREGQDLLPPSRDKTRGVFLTYQAKSHLDLAEPELAAAAALKSLELAQRIGAPRCVQLVRDLIPRFEEHPGAQGIPELLERAAA